MTDRPTVNAPSRRSGMGALPYRGGTTFRVWAPHADAVFVTGSFDDWAMTTNALVSREPSVPPRIGRSTGFDLSAFAGFFFAAFTGVVSESNAHAMSRWRIMRIS